MIEQIHIASRVGSLRLKAANKYNIPPNSCHIGHVVLQAMLECPNMIHQIDGVTGESETHQSVATRSMRLAKAMDNCGFVVGDQVINIGYNTIDLCVPFYACTYNGYAHCAIDPRIPGGDLSALFKFVQPKIIFCPKANEEDVKEALKSNNYEGVQILVYDDVNNNLEAFIKKYNGTEENFRPAQFDQAKTTCWLMLTSGTTGIPKAAIIPYETLLNGLLAWWSQFPDKCKILLAMTSIQWMSTLLFFISSPLMKNTRLQASETINPLLLIKLINTYKPNMMVLSPYNMAQFMGANGGSIDLTCFKYIAVGGSAIDKTLLDRFKEKCPAYLYLVYGMTELLVPVFDFNKNTPFGSTGKPFQRFQYRLVDDEGKTIEKPNETGELWIKGDAFFKGYLNNPEETNKLLTDDGWLMTGDMFYRTEENYYYFVERKRLMFKHTGFWISPLQVEEVIKKHPGVAEACLIDLPDKMTGSMPVAAVVKKPGHEVKPEEIFDLVRSALPAIKQIHGGLFFVDTLPETPSGKVHRAKVRDWALTTEKIFPLKN